MTGIKLVIVILQVISAFILSLVVLIQSGKRSGLSGAIAGAADTFMAKGKARTIDGKLAKSTKYFAIVFVVLTIVANML